MMCRNCNEDLSWITDSKVMSINETGVEVIIFCAKCETEHYWSFSQGYLYDWSESVQGKGN